jgi:hypothetical protein
MAIAKRHEAAEDTWRGRQKIPKRLKTPHAISEVMNQKRMAAGELQQAFTWSLMLVRREPALCSTGP